MSEGGEELRGITERNGEQSTSIVCSVREFHRNVSGRSDVVIEFRFTWFVTHVYSIRRKQLHGLEQTDSDGSWGEDEARIRRWHCEETRG